MNTQAALADILNQCALDKVEVLKVTGDANGTKIQTHDVEKTLYIVGQTKEAIADFEGEFGITNLKMLAGLVKFTNFKGEGSSMTVRKRTVAGAKVLDQFEFRGAGSRSTFKLMDMQHVPAQQNISAVPWTVVLTEISKAKVAEFQSFAGLYKEIDDQFTVMVEDNALVMDFGKEASSTHSGRMTFAENIEGTLSGALRFPVDKFLLLMKIALAAQSSSLKLIGKGLLGVEAVTECGTYQYYLRQAIRG